MSLCCYTVLVFFLLIIVIIITVYPIALLILALNNDRIKLRYYIMTDFTEINMSCAPGGAARDYKAQRGGYQTAGRGCQTSDFEKER